MSLTVPWDKFIDPVDRLLIMDGRTRRWRGWEEVRERVIGSARLGIDGVRRELSCGPPVDESRRLEGHLVEMGLGKNRINGRIYILVRERCYERKQRRSFWLRIKRERVYCAANGRYADVALYY